MNNQEKLCKICQKPVNEKQFRYCLECRTKYKKPSDVYYHKHNPKRQSKEYKENATKIMLKWIENNKEKYTQRQAEYLYNIKKETLTYYSNTNYPSCVKCGESNDLILCLDHINNDGKINGKRDPNFKIYLSALEEKDKSKYQCLCYNCNWKKHIENLKTKNSNNKEAIKRREIHKNNKIQCIKKYSNDTCKCVKCGKDDIDVLCLDHINNDGNIHRKELDIKNGPTIYRWVFKNNFPPIFQTLCFNCNILKLRLLTKKNL